jgi:protein O-mannosyl-transferase
LLTTERLAGRMPHLIGICLIAALVGGLYLPFLSNPPVFDDGSLFSGARFFYYATHPFGLELRLPSAFSFAITQVFSGRIEVHRIVNLVLHLTCSLALFKLFYELLKATERPVISKVAVDENLRATTWAFIGAAAFAIHPVAVYGAAYLIERTIVLATLFSALSILLFVRGLIRGSRADAVSAAFLYSVAVLCKEHCVLLPAVAILTVPLVQVDRRVALRHTAIYLSACVPAAIFVTLLAKGLIGRPYEPEFDAIANQVEVISGFNIAKSPWSLSVVTQAGLFFRYLWLWLWPDTGAMSIDLHVDFRQASSLLWGTLGCVAFVAYGVAGFLLLRRGGKAGLIGFGLLYAWVLFLIEFSVARFQEPFVLYRSYLWAPGILLALIGLLRNVPPRVALAAFALACPVLMYQARDRLATFTSPLLLWQDAAAKLPEKPIPWGSRTLYNLGREYLYHDQPDKAIETTERCMALYPNTAHCYYARGAIHLQLEQFKLALPYFTRAIELQPDSGVIYHRLGMVMEGLDRIDEAKALYRHASALGYKGAEQNLARLETPGRGILPPRKKSSTP